MKRVLLFAKILVLVVAATAAVIGFGFFRVWKANDVPRVTRISWQQEQVLLSRSTILRMEIITPWHRDIVRAKPSRLPDSLTANSAARPTLKRGSLDGSGHRRWQVSIPLVATTPGTLSGETIELPLSTTRRKSARTVVATLPDLEVTVPDSLPADPLNPLDLLTEVPPPPASTGPVAEDVSPSLWPLAVAALLVAGGAFFLVRWLRRPKPEIPAWEIAHSSLDRLQGQTSLRPERFFSRLTDISETVHRRAFPRQRHRCLIDRIHRLAAHRWATSGSPTPPLCRNWSVKQMR